MKWIEMILTLIVTIVWLTGVCIYTAALDQLHEEEEDEANNK